MRLFWRLLWCSSWLLLLRKANPCCRRFRWSCWGFCSRHCHLMSNHIFWPPQVKGWASSISLKPFCYLCQLLRCSEPCRSQVKGHTLLSWRQQPRLATLRSLWPILEPLWPTLMALSMLSSSTRVSMEAETRATTTPPYSSISRRRWCRQIRRCFASFRTTFFSFLASLSPDSFLGRGGGSGRCCAISCKAALLTIASRTSPCSS